MDAAGTVHERAIVYLEAGRIVDVRPQAAAPPLGFADVDPILTRGTIFPGLIELHNHLPYNVLTLWNVPEKFEHRGRWSSHAEKQQLVTDPMSVLGKAEGFIEAVVRYVECKCLVGGVTTSQGISLFSNTGSQRFYKGVIRNVEQTDDPDLPEASTRVADVEAENAAKFLQGLERSAAKGACKLLHLSEGLGPLARKHFEALKLDGGGWAINEALAGIHGLGLSGEDHRVLVDHDGSIIWSPLSNMLLYGRTLDLPSVKEAHVRLGMGSDWSPTGSKNLLGELKVARIESERQGGVFDDRELVAMVTSNAAQILGWEKVLGSIEPGKYADLVVIGGQQGEPHARLIEAKDTDVKLVIVGGVPRFGMTSLMEDLGGGSESWRLGRAKRTFNLAQESGDPVVGALSLDAARSRLKDGMGNLPELARSLERQRAPGTRGAGTRGPSEPRWFLILDEDEPPGLGAALGQPSDGRALSTPGGPIRSFRPRAPRPPLSERVKPVKLDPLTVRDDDLFLDSIDAQRNLPAAVKEGLRRLYA
jgi:cytosine/adenosine deaminase-related metal-dependent hydrolase